MNAICMLRGHDLRTPWPGTHAFCMRCNQKWGPPSVRTTN